LFMKISVKRKEISLFLLSRKIRVPLAEYPLPHPNGRLPDRLIRSFFAHPVREFYMQVNNAQISSIPI
jgi:hypothetical protein